MQLACLAAGLTQQATDDLIGRIESQEVKEELKRTTQEALDLGVWFLCPCLFGQVAVMIFFVVGIWSSFHCGPHWRQEGRVLWKRSYGTAGTHTGREVGGATCRTQGSFVTALMVVSEGHIIF